MRRKDTNNLTKLLGDRSLTVLDRLMRMVSAIVVVEMLMLMQAIAQYVVHANV